MSDGNVARMLIRYNDGTHEEYEYKRMDESPTMLSAMGEALSANHVVLKLDDKVVLIPFGSIRSIEISPPPSKLPRHAMLDVRLIG